jgi:hypothetical protein
MLQISRVAELPGMGPIAGSAAASVAPDGKRLFLTGGPSVLAVDSYSLAVEGRWTIGADTLGLALSPDGRRLYVGQAGEVIRLDSASGAALGRLPKPDLTGLRRVIDRTP